MSSIDNKKHVFIIGFMGSGKTSVAKKIALKTALSWVDLDMRITALKHKSIPEIFDDFGEVGFRNMETNAIKSLAIEPPSVVSCGGGIVLRRENIDLMKKDGIIIYLDVDFDESVSRISRLDTRPLLKDIDKAKELYLARKPIYKDASDVTIKACNSNVYNVACRCISFLKKEGFLYV